MTPRRVLVYKSYLLYFLAFTVTVIFTVFLEPSFSVTVAEIVALPAFLPMIVPFLLTVATDLLLVLYVMLLTLALFRVFFRAILLVLPAVTALTLAFGAIVALIALTRASFSSLVII